MRETRTSGSAGGGAKPIASPYPDHKHRACSDDTLLLQSLGYTDNEIERTLDERQFFVRILASRKHGTLYIGVYGPRLSPG